MSKTGKIVIILGLFCSTVFAQPERVGAGLTFATERSFNVGYTGNPGIVIRVWIPLEARQVLQFVPSISVYSPHRYKRSPSYYTTTYMFQGDLDIQYKVIQDKSIIISALAGVNYTHILSRVTYISVLPDQPVNDDIYGFGPNIGAALEMRMHSHWDFILTGKYCFGGIIPRDPLSTDFASLKALVLQIQGVYYFTSRGKAFYRQ